MFTCVFQSAWCGYIHVFCRVHATTLDASQAVSHSAVSIDGQVQYEVTHVLNVLIRVSYNCTSSLCKRTDIKSCNPVHAMNYNNILQQYIQFEQLKGVPEGPEYKFHKKWLTDQIYRAGQQRISLDLEQGTSFFRDSL
jgi:hypothetical protein